MGLKEVLIAVGLSFARPSECRSGVRSLATIVLNKAPHVDS